MIATACFHLFVVAAVVKPIGDPTEVRWNQKTIGYKVAEGLEFEISGPMILLLEIRGPSSLKNRKVDLILERDAAFVSKNSVKLTRKSGSPKGYPYGGRLMVSVEGGTHRYRITGESRVALFAFKKKRLKKRYAAAAEKPLDKPQSVAEAPAAEELAAPEPVADEPTVAAASQDPGEQTSHADGDTSSAADIESAPQSKSAEMEVASATADVAETSESTTETLLVAAAPEAASPPADDGAAFADAPGDSTGSDASWGDDSGGAFGDEEGGFFEESNLETSWGGYGDLFLGLNALTNRESFDFLHFTAVLSAELLDTTRALLVIDFQKGGARIVLERAYIEHEFFEWLGARAGKFNIPIGRFNEQLSNSFRWGMVSWPLLTREVIPTVWPGLGITLYGAVPISEWLSFNYTAWVANGLGSMPMSSMDMGGMANMPGMGGGGGVDTPVGLDFDTGWWKLVPEVLRGLREHVFDMSEFGDFNRDKAFGGRFEFDLFETTNFPLITAFSFYTGAMDQLERDRLTILAVDLELRIADLTLRGEAARSYIDATPQFLSFAFEQGFYILAAYHMGDFELAIRWDHAETRPYFGKILVQRELVASVMYQLNTFLNFRAEVRFPLKLKRFSLNGGVLVAFAF